MKTLLLLAGRSRRFWPLSEKPLFSLCGKTIAEHQVERLRKAGLTDIVLIVSDNNKEQLADLFPDLEVVEQEDATGGMYAALQSALPHCKDEPILVVGGNDLFDADALKSLVEASKTDDTGGAILAQKVESYFPGGYLKVDSDRITDIVEKPGEGNEPSDLVNIVAHVHNDPAALKAALDEMKGNLDDAYERALDQLFETHTYKAVPYEGTWQAVKYPWHVLEVLPLLLDEIEGQQIHSSAEIHETAVITGDVVIEEGVRVMPHATVVGPCYLGKGVIVANNALARGSSIGEGSIVGYSTEVKGSALQGHVWTHMTYIGDSVIGSNVSFGAGSVTGNLRLDEAPVASKVGDEPVSTNLVKCGAFIGDDTRFGVHTTISPGCKIGQGTFVSSCTYVTEDIPEGQFARMKDGTLKVSENTAEVPQPDDRKVFRSKL